MPSIDCETVTAFVFLHKPSNSNLDVPDAPQSLTIKKISNDSATLIWEPPENDGGNQIDGYNLERKETNSLLWTQVTKVCGWFVKFERQQQNSVPL